MERWLELLIKMPSVSAVINQCYKYCDVLCQARAANHFVITLVNFEKLIMQILFNVCNNK